MKQRKRYIACNAPKAGEADFASVVEGLGISGGTGEEDHSLAEYALSVLPEIL